MTHSPDKEPAKTSLRLAWFIIFLPMLLSFTAALTGEGGFFFLSILLIIPCGLIWGICLGAYIGCDKGAKIAAAILLSIVGICFSLGMTFAGCSLIIQMGGTV